MKRTICLAVFALGLAGTVGAQPSIYFKWKNAQTGATMCEPEPPGAQWQKIGGPFSDVNCSIKMPE